MASAPSSRPMLQLLSGCMLLLGLWSAPTALAASATVRIEGDWQPKLSCDGCNPGKQWEGDGAANTESESVLVDDLEAGELLRFGGLGGSVLNGSQRVDCVAGDRDTVRTPLHTPLLQFIDDAGRVVALPDNGYAGTQSLRLIDVLRSGVIVPEGATGLWGSWPDTDYGNNEDLCYFTLIREGEHPEEASPAQPSSSSSSSQPMTERETERRERVQSRVSASSRANLVERITSGPAGVSGNAPALLDRLPVENSRLLCSVQSRFLQPGTLTITRVRLAERLAARFSVSPISLVPALQQEAACNTYFPDRPSLPNAGGPSGTPSPSSSAPVSSSPSVQRTPRAVRTQSPREPAAATVPSAPAEEGLTLEAKLRMLCRVQERGMQDPMGFREQVSTIAQRFADRWDMSAPAITAALLSTALCNEPATISLDGPATPAEPMENGTGSSIVGSASSDDDPPSPFDTFFSLLPGLPPMVLIVASLAVVTFLTLVVLLIVPLFKREG